MVDVCSREILEGGGCTCHPSQGHGRSRLSKTTTPTSVIDGQRPVFPVMRGCRRSEAEGCQRQRLRPFFTFAPSAMTSVRCVVVVVVVVEPAEPSVHPRSCSARIRDCELWPWMSPKAPCASLPMAPYLQCLANQSAWRASSRNQYTRPARGLACRIEDVGETRAGQRQTGSWNPGVLE